MNTLTTKELIKEYNLIIDEYYKTNQVHSLSDFEEIILELNKRQEI
jgi:hypothetical protein